MLVVVVGGFAYLEEFWRLVVTLDFRLVCFYRVSLAASF